MCEEVMDVLGQEPEQMPGWLGAGPPFEFNRDDFFGSRTLYYPGSGGDGHPVSVCARSGAAHTFVYVDYGPGRETIREWLDGPDPEELPQDRPARTEQCGFRGYFVEHEEDVRESALRPGGWIPHADPPNAQRNMLDENDRPFALFVVLRRDEGHDRRRGPERLAGLFVGGDGIATYDALYCQRDGTPAPYLVVLQDHGFGDNYDRFGGGGLLERIAESCDVWPGCLLVAEGTDAWKGYRPIEARSERGGMHGTRRFLYQMRRDE